MPPKGTCWGAASPLSGALFGRKIWEQEDTRNATALTAFVCFLLIAVYLETLSPVWWRQFFPPLPKSSDGGRLAEASAAAEMR